VSQPTGVIYARISKDTLGTGLGVNRQLADCRDLAAQRGIIVVAELVENDVSAYSGKPRPEYEKLLELIRTGQTSSVLVYHADRLHRSTRELESYIDACAVHGVPTYTVRAGDLDLTTPAGRAVAKTVGAWAQYESEVKGERIQRKKLELAEAGLPAGGRRPFGYEQDQVTVVRAEGDLLLAATRHVLAGGSLREIARAWNSAAIPTSRGYEWTPQRVRDVLTRPRNAGIRVHNSDTTSTEYPAAWEPVVPLEEFRALERLLRDPSRRTSRGGQVTYLLTGIARCGARLPDGTTCDATMITSSSGKTKRTDGSRAPKLHTYGCSRRPKQGVQHATMKRSIADETVEEWIMSAVEELGVAPLAASERPQVPPTRNVDDLQAEEDFQRSLYNDGLLSQDAYRAELTRIAVARRELDNASVREVSVAAAARVAEEMSTDPRGTWGRMSTAERRQFLRDHVSVTILPMLGVSTDPRKRVVVSVDPTFFRTDERDHDHDRVVWERENPQLSGESLLEYMERGPQ